MSLKATVTNISRCSLHDGPGVRTVIYFKGCELRCRWCHNPETLSCDKQLLYLPQKCIFCGRCIELCPEHHTVKGDKMLLVRSGCTLCGKCADSCPSEALTVCGREMTCDELFSELEKDIHYYKATGGGVTFSGGECLLQAEFLKELAGRCAEKGIHTAVETALFVPWDNIERLVPVTDLFYTDLKIANPVKNIKYTGRDNSLIIENLRKLSNIAENIIIRIPVIPGVNDSSEDFIGFADIIRTLGGGIQKIELLRYNNLAESKYDMLGIKYHGFSDSSQDDEQMRKYTDMLSELTEIPCFFV